MQSLDDGEYGQAVPGTKRGSEAPDRAVSGAPSPTAGTTDRPPPERLVPPSSVTPALPVLPAALALVLFDLDGVLIDSEPLSITVMAETLGACGVATTYEECRREFTGLTLAAVRPIVEHRIGRPIDPDFERAYEESLFERFGTELQTFPGTTDLLDALRRAGVLSCVASNGTERRIRIALGATGLLGRLGSRIFGVEMVERPKPAPDVFVTAAAALGVPPSRCLVIDDTPVGIAAARAAAMSVWAPATTYHPSLLKAADHVASSMTALCRSLIAALESGGQTGSPGARI